jgi:hypothetical protein
MKTLVSLASMSIFTVVMLVLVITTVADADVHVNGYYRGNGTYVQPHYRSDPDGLRSNNWSTYPNVNPRTGVRGSRHLSTEDFSNISLQNKPTNLPVYPSGIPGHSSSWNEPTPMPYNPSDNNGRVSLVAIQ